MSTRLFSRNWILNAYSIKRPFSNKRPLLMCVNNEYSCNKAIFYNLLLASKGRVLLNQLFTWVAFFFTMSVFRSHSSKPSVIKSRGFRDFREIHGLKFEIDFYFTSCQHTFHEWVWGRGKQEFWPESFQISGSRVSWKPSVLKIRKVSEVQESAPKDRILLRDLV